MLSADKKDQIYKKGKIIEKIKAVDKDYYR